MGLDPLCKDDSCHRYFLPGGLDTINTTCERLVQGIEGFETICEELGKVGLSDGDLGTLGAVLPIFGGPANGTQGVDILGELRNGSGSTFKDLLGGGGFFNGSSLIGGLSKVRRNVDPASLGNLGGGLLELNRNAVNWSDFRSNLTKEFGMAELAYVVYNARGYIVDFSPLDGPDWPKFNNLCKTFDAAYQVNISMTFCMATETAGKNSSTIVAGVRFCDEFGIFGIRCSDENKSLVYTSRMHIQTATGTTAYSMVNQTILSFKNLSTPTDYPINVTAFFDSLLSPFMQSKLVAILEFGNPVAATDTTPLLVLSLLGDFVYGGQGPHDGSNQLRNLMANALTSASASQSVELNSSPHGITRIIYTIRIAPATLYAFIILGSALLLWCLPVMVWSTMYLVGNTNAFPEVEFAAKIVSAGMLEGISNAESKDVVRKLGGDLDIFLGESVREKVDGGKAPAVVLDSAPVAKLRRDVGYY